MYNFSNCKNRSFFTVGWVEECIDWLSTIKSIRYLPFFQIQILIFPTRYILRSWDPILVHEPCVTCNPLWFEIDSGRFLPTSSPGVGCSTGPTLMLPHLSRDLPSFANNLTIVYMSIHECFPNPAVSASFRNDAGLQTDFRGCQRTRLCNYFRAEVVH